MYIKYKRYKEHPDRVYLQLVESIREGKYVRKKTVLSFGRVDNGDALERVNKFMKALLPVSSAIEVEPTKDINPICSKMLCPLVVFKKLWKDLELERYLRAHWTIRRLSLTLSRRYLTYTICIN